MSHYNNEEEIQSLKDRVEKLETVIYQVCDIVILAPRMLEATAKIQDIFEKNLEKILRVEDEMEYVTSELSTLRNLWRKLNDVIRR